jgi:hypothetical protein
MKKLIIPLLIGCILTSAFLWKNLTWPAVNITSTVGTNDLTDLNYPFRYFLSESLKRGEFPVWSSAISNGYPLFAEGQIAAAYPPNMLFAYFLPLMESLNASIFLMYLIIFIGTYAYFSLLKLSKPAAIFASIITAFSGFAANELLHFGMTVSFGYFLVQMALVQLFLNNNEMRFTQQLIISILMGITLGLSILGGHPQIIFYSLIYLFIYWIFGWLSSSHRLLKNSKYHKSQNSKLKINNSFPRLKIVIGKLIVISLIFLIIGLSIGAAQLLPQTELTLNSNRRGGVSAASIGRYSYPITAVMDFINPFSSYRADHTYEAFVNNGWPIDERYVYPGLLALGFMVYGLWVVWRKKEVRYQTIGKIFTLTFIISVFFAFGTQLMFGYFLTLPPFSFFRLPFRIIFLTSFAIAGLSAIGFDNLILRLKPKLQKKKQSLSNCISTYYLVPSALCLLLFFDLYYQVNRLHPAVNANDWYKKPETVSYLKDHLEGEERVFNQYYFYPSIKIFLTQPENWDKRESLINLRNLDPVFNNLLYHINKPTEAANSAGLKVDRYNELETELFFNGLPYITTDTVESTDTFNFLNRLMGVRYVVTGAPVKSDLLSEVKKVEFANDQDPVRIYEYMDYYPRAFMVPKAEKAEAQAIKEHLYKGDFDAKQKIFIEEDSDWSAKGGFTATTEIKKYTDQKVEIETQSAGDGWLFLSDTYYPGWKASVDGKNKKIYLANYAFRAVQVPEGHHQVIFTYEPTSFNWGLKITIVTSIITIISLIALTIFNFTKRFHLVR